MLKKIRPHQLGFDFDGVIADIGEAFLRLACQKYNYCSFTLDDIVSFDVETCINIPSSIVLKIFDDILVDSLATKLLPMPGMIEVLQKISTIGPINIITARSQPQPVLDWFNNYLPASTCKKINLFAMGDHDNKVRYLQQLGISYFIDDRPETCRLITEANLLPLLYSHPWNRKYDSYKRVNNWQEIGHLIDFNKELP